jgi:hypothetical protein
MSLHASEHQVLNPIFKDGQRHNLLDNPVSWTPAREAKNQSKVRIWSRSDASLMIIGPPEDITRIVVTIETGNTTTSMAATFVIVGLHHGLFSPDRFDEQITHEAMPWMTEQIEKYASAGKAVRAVRRIGDVDVVMVVKLGTVSVQFRHKDAPDDFASEIGM